VINCLVDSTKSDLSANRLHLDNEFILERGLADKIDDWKRIINESDTNRIGAAA
jgi:hypothetical protein